MLITLWCRWQVYKWEASVWPSEFLPHKKGHAFKIPICKDTQGSISLQEQQCCFRQNIGKSSFVFSRVFSLSIIAHHCNSNWKSRLWIARSLIPVEVQTSPARAPHSSTQSTTHIQGPTRSHTCTHESPHIPLCRFHEGFWTQSVAESFGRWSTKALSKAVDMWVMSNSGRERQKAAE